MKKIYLPVLLTIIMVNQFLFAQTYCGSDRYDKEVFTNYGSSMDVTYGQAKNFYGSNQVLKMDIYQPSGDTIPMRPLIIWVHGGSFIGGDKLNGSDVVDLARKFSKRGYVTASINYRLYYFPLNDEVQAKKAVMRAVQDLKAAVRFFRKDAYSTNTYKIDTNNIFVGGSSAGAFTAMHMAYLDTDSEFASEIDTTGLGGLEGNSGNPGYLSTAKAVINLCGALGGAKYLTYGDEPLVSMHGTADGTVPYASAPIPQVPSLLVDGSYSINKYADSIGVTNAMYTWFGADHTPYVAGGTAGEQAAYMDTTVRFICNFLYTVLQCTPTDPNPLPNTFTGIPEAITTESHMRIFPNPTTGKFQISFNGGEQIQKIEVFNILGEVISRKENIKSSNTAMNISENEKGIYFLKVYSNGKEEVKKLILN